MQLQMLTYSDAISHCLDYLGAATDVTTERVARRAVQSAINAIWNDRNWVYFYQRGRINTVANYATGTVDYDYTGGSVERQVTLAGGTLPTWAAFGTLVIDNVTYDLFSRVSATVAQMASQSNPGIDIASTSYNLFQNTYTLPIDFGAMGQVICMGHGGMMGYLSPDDFLSMQRTQVSPAQPTSYTLMGDPRRYGTLAIRFYPPPDNVYAMDFTYRRSPRQLNVIGYDYGTVAVANGSATVTGTGTNWNSTMQGSIIRFGANGDTTIPTGPTGANPCVLERAVVSVASATQLTLDAVSSTDTLTNVKHSISDPVDIEAGAMLEYFMRSVERQARILRRMKATIDEERQYKEAQMMAFEADARNYESRSTFGGGVWPVRLAQMPAGPDL